MQRESPSDAMAELDMDKTMIDGIRDGRWMREERCERCEKEAER